MVMFPKHGEFPSFFLSLEGHHDGRGDPLPREPRSPGEVGRSAVARLAERPGAVKGGKAWHHGEIHREIHGKMMWEHPC